jgi:hypothetical protein
MPQVTDVTSVFACMQIGRVQVSCNFAVFSDRWYAHAETCSWQLLRRRGDESEHQELVSCAQQWERKIKEVRQHVPRCLMLMKKSHGNPPTLAA